MVATHACWVAPQLRTIPLSISSPSSNSSALTVLSLTSLQSSIVGLAPLRRTCSSADSVRLPWTQSARRPVLRRGADKPISQTQEPMKPLSVVDKDGKVDAVIQVEVDESPQPTWGRIYTLGGGDVVFLLLFAAIGRSSHGFPVLDWETVRTADPFIGGWFVGSYFTGGYGPEGQGLKGLKTASLAAVKSWAVAFPLALGIRGFAIGHVPAAPFMVVSLASTFVLQVGWRTAFTIVFPNDEKSFQKRKDNRKGSFFEFFEANSAVSAWSMVLVLLLLMFVKGGNSELLTSLVKRW